MYYSKMDYERIKAEIKNEDFGTLKKRIENGEYLTEIEYKAVLENTRDKRMDWFRKGRFGVIVHYGLYSVLERGEWAIMYDSIPMKEYELLMEKFMPKPDAAEEWVLTAKEAGAKYVILTTRHHEGFSLWNSKVNPYNSYNCGCKRDLVQEFVDACRKHDMRIGLYSSLMDWYHPDAKYAQIDLAARRRFLDYIEALNVELLTNYGKIDMLWYDTPFPMESADAWETLHRNQKLRILQPDIIINNRAMMSEDMVTPEDVLESADGDWEACHTVTGLNWGYIDEEQAKPYAVTPQQLVKRLTFCCRNCGNLIMNMGPKADGSVAAYEKELFQKVGAWIRENEEVVYGDMRPNRGPGGIAGPGVFGEYGAGTLAEASAKGNTVYIWSYIWPANGTMYVAGYKSVPKNVYLVKNKQKLDFEYDAENFRIIIRNLPEKSPDTILGITIIAVEFDEKPIYRWGMSLPQLTGGYIER